ncbi:MAG: sodium:proton antiporter [Lysobacterales bacterium]
MRIELMGMLALLVAAGFACQWLAWRIRVPAIVLLLLVGLGLGPFTHLLAPDELFGSLLFPVVSLAVAVILFEGSLGLRLHELRGIGAAVQGLISYGAVVSLALLTIVAHGIAGLGWPLALLFGALACVTGPTVIAPMLRTLRPNMRIANTLRWEGIVLDPLGALVAVLIYEFIAARARENPLWMFAFGVVTGAVIGVAAALVLGFLLRRRWIPDYLQAFGTLAFVVVAFTASNTFKDDTGLLAVTVMGMTLGNLRDLHLDDIREFKEQLVALLVSMLFILLAARLPWPLPGTTLLQGIVIYLSAQFVARPLSVFLATAGSQLTWRERGLVAWVAPRGIVAAAVSAVFALRLRHLGVPGADQLVPLVFIMIIGTVVVQGATARPLAHWLGVVLPEPRGVLVYGSDVVARTIAAALHGIDGFRVVLADDDWDNVGVARMAGLETFFGNPASRLAQDGLDLTGVGHLFAISPQRELNALACLHYREVFGRDNVYRLRNVLHDEGPDRSHFAAALLAPALFGEDMTHARFAALLEEGWTIRGTRLSKVFDWPMFLARNGEDSRPLFALDDRGAFRVVSERRGFVPGEGWTVLALVPPAAAGAR